MDPAFMEVPGEGGGAAQLPSHFTLSPGGDCLNFDSLQINQMPVILVPQSPPTVT